jgi:hypothetical protein
MKPDLQDLIIAIDRGFASEMVLLEAELIRDGVSRDRIDALLKKHCEDFLIWRAEGLSELRDWLVDCNRKLH